MFLIFIISIIIYVVAAIAIYHNVYNFEQNKKILFIIIGLIVVFIATWILVTICSSNIEIPNREYKSYEEYIGTTKLTALLLFAPINAIIFLPYIGNTLNKYAEDRIDKEQVQKRFLILLLIIFVVSIFEIGYVKDFQIGLIEGALRSR